MNIKDKVAVCSRSFSNHPVLRAELLRRYQSVTFNESGHQFYGDELIAFLAGHTKAITALETIDDYVLSSLPELEVIGKYGVGLDMIDMSAMRKHGKKLGWVGGVNRRSVAELTIAFAIILLRHIVVGNQEILDGGWRQLMGGLLSGRVVGIVGCGHVGKDLVGMLQPFECKILVNDIRNYSEFYDEYGIEAVGLEELVSRSDVVTLHVPRNSSTENIISEGLIATMKPSAILLNAARGGLVDEQALKLALIEKRIAGAAFDVFSEEPPQDRELLELSNFLATPHIGGSAAEAIIAMGMAAIDGLESEQIP
ncbi:phosphoglycerate dehydrogenase [Porticoccaceae bacterium]|nr:phosphoglycerate dehydrogenase [Porticoccaceae bacterium]